jgi:hypothetical protein
MDKRFDSHETMAPVVRCHEAQIIELRQQLRHMQKQLDTLGSPWWKRLWFRIDGWPAWYVVAERRAWRPWHRR